MQKKPLLWQVQAAPKPKAVPKPDSKSEPVEPQTWMQKASSVMATLLKDAADARTASIKLQSMEYAKELSGQLLGHAKKLEELYQQLSTAISQQAEDKKLKSLLKKAVELEAFGAKAQALAGVHVQSTTKNPRNKPVNGQTLSHPVLICKLTIHIPYLHRVCFFSTRYLFVIPSHVPLPMQAAADAFLKPSKAKKGKGKAKAKKQKK